MAVYEKYDFNTRKADDVIQKVIGRSVDTDFLAELEERRSTIEGATRHIAKALMRGSDGKINPYRTEDPIFDLTTNSGEVSLVKDRYQNWNILPSVASANRKDMANNLDLFFHVCESREAFEVADSSGEIKTIPYTKIGQSVKYRYAVFTGGSRCLISDTEKRIKSIRCLLSKAIKKLKEEGIYIDIIFQSVEDTLKRDAHNIVWVHPHLNVIYRFRRQLRKREWAAFLRIMNEVMDGKNWRDCGVLKDAKEVVKYVTKMKVGSEGGSASASDECGKNIFNNDPISYDYGKEIGLLDLSDEELCEYFYQVGPIDKRGKTKRRKLLLPLGDFQKFCSVFKEWGIRFRPVNIDGKSVATPIAREKRQKSSDSHKTPGKSGRVENLILSETMPFPDIKSGCMATKLKVAGFNPRPTTKVGKRRLAIIKGIVERRCEAAVANGQNVEASAVWKRLENRGISKEPINVHTMHDTSCGPPPTKSGEVLRDVPRKPRSEIIRFLSSTNHPFRAGISTQTERRAGGP